MKNGDILRQLELIREQVNVLANRPTAPLDGSSQLFTAYMQQWFVSKKTSLSVNTYDKYETLYKIHIAPAFRGLMLTDITIERLQLFINDLIKTLSASTIREIKSSIIAPALKRAVGMDLIKKNPADFVNCPKVKQQHKRPLTNEEIVRLAAVAREDHLWIAVPLLIYTGIRRSEMLALTWNDVDFEAKTININKGYVVTRSKGNLLNGTKTEDSDRLVAVPVGLIQFLKRYKETLGKGRTYIISQVKNDKMVSPDNFSRTFRRWCDQAGIQGISPHSTRHTYCTLCQENELDTFTIMRQVGHTTSRMLEKVYVHKRTNELQQRGAEKIGVVLDGLISA